MMTSQPSATQTQTRVRSEEGFAEGEQAMGILVLEGADEVEDVGSASSSRPRRRVTWDDKVVDNEDLGRKSSKVCCIYHKPREVGESSSSSDSSSDESASEDDERRGSRRPTQSPATPRSPNAYEHKPASKRHRHSHHHRHSPHT